jgi:hypothetical protein
VERLDCIDTIANGVEGVVEASFFANLTSSMQNEHTVGPDVVVNLKMVHID